VICPLKQLVNGLFVYDRGQDGKTDLSKPDPVYSKITFLSGADVYMPAQNPPVGKVSVVLRSRGGGPERTVTFPNFPSTSDVVSIQLNDFEQTAPAPAKAATPATCLGRSRFAFRIHQPLRGRIVRVDAYIDGHRVKHLHGRRITRLTLRRPAGKTDFRVVIVAFSAKGQRTISVRRVHRCSKTRPSTRVHRSRRGT
jgi:hypothetical protein